MIKMAGEKFDQLLQIYGQEAKENTLRFGGKPVSNQLFAGLSMVLMHSNKMRKGLKLTGVLPVNGTELLRDNAQVPKADMQKIQAYVTAALKAGKLDALAPALAEGLNGLGAQIRDYDWRDPSCCAAARLLGETMAELEKVSKTMRALKTAGLKDEARSNIAVGKLMSDTMDKRALAETELLSDGPLTDEKQSQYARDIVKAELLLELCGPSAQANDEKTAFSSMLRDLATGSKRNEATKQAVNSTVEDNLRGAYKNLLSGKSEERKATIEHPASMGKDIGQLSRRWFDLYGIGANDAWAELYKRRTLARRRIRASVEEQKQQGKTSFQVDPEDVAWLIAEKVTTDELEKAKRGGPADYDFLHLFAAYQTIDDRHLGLFGSALKSYCLKQVTSHKNAYTESELLGDDLGKLYDGELIGAYKESAEQNIWNILEEEASLRGNIPKAENSEKKVKKIPPDEAHIEFLNEQLASAAEMDKMLLRYQNVYGPAVDRDQEEPTLILVQRECVPKESEYENPAFAPEDIAAFGILATMSIPENVEIVKEDKAYSLIRDMKEGVDWVAAGKAAAFQHSVEDVFILRENTAYNAGRLVPKARTILREGFDQLAKGNAEPLGRLIGENVTMMLRDAAMMDTKDGKLSPVERSYNTLFTRILKVMDEHPELKTSAMRHGMTEKDMRALRAAEQYNKITMDGIRAEKDLLTDVMREDSPDDPQRLKNLLTDCVTKQVMFNIIDGHNKHINELRTAAMNEPVLNAPSKDHELQIQISRPNSVTLRTPISEELCRFGDLEALKKLRKQISESAFIQEMLNDREKLKGYAEMLKTGKKLPEGEAIADGLRTEVRTEEEKRKKALEEQTQRLESIPNYIASHEQDVLDVYGSRIQHFENAGEDMKKRSQNLIRPETMYDLPEGWTQKQIAALNVLSAMTLDIANNVDVCNGSWPKQKEAGEHILSSGVDPTTHGISWTNSNLILDLIIRRKNSLERISGPRILNPARVKMKRALDAYINEQNPKPLGEILGKTLTTYAGFNKTGQVSSGWLAYLEIAGTVCDLLNKDPALKDSARSFGLTDATMATLSSEAALGKYYLNGARAEQQLLSGKELSDEEFYDSMSSLVMEALARRCTEECEEANLKNQDQFKAQMMRRVLPDGHSLDGGVAGTAELLIVSEADRLSQAQTLGTKRFQKLSDPTLKQKIRSAVEKNETIHALRSEPEKLEEFRRALGEHRGDGMNRFYTKEFAKQWLPNICDPFLPVLDSCRIAEERPLDDKCREAEDLLNLTREELEQMAKAKNISLSDYIDRKETEKVWQERDEEYAWMRKTAGQFGKTREQLAIEAYSDNMTVREKVEQYKQEIRETAQRFGMSEDQLNQMAKDKHTDPLTLSNQMNAEEEKRKKAIEARIRQLESMPEKIAGFDQDIVDVYGSRVEHIEETGRDVKKKTQNLIQEETMYDPPEGFTQKQIAALNVLTGLSLEYLDELTDNPDPENKEVTSHLSENGIDLMMSGFYFANSDQVEDLVHRRENSLDKICGPHTMNTARVKLKKALDAYTERRDPEPLGEILGKTLGMYAGFNKNGDANVGLLQYAGIAGTAYQLLKSDPALEISAREHGLTDSTMQTLSAEGALRTYYADSAEAERQILAGDKLTPEEFYDCMSGLVMDALIQQCMKENEAATNRNTVQFKEQMLRKLVWDGKEDAIFRGSVEETVGTEAIMLASAKTPGTERFRKLSDPELKTKIRSAVENDEKLNALLTDPEKLNKFRRELGIRSNGAIQGSEDYAKHWQAGMLETYLPVLDTCRIMEERPLEVKSAEAERLLGMTPEEMAKQAEEKGLSLSDYIDQEETERVWKGIETERKWLERVSGLLGMDSIQLTKQARANNMTVAEKVEQYKQEIRKTAQRFGVSEEQFIRTAEEKHTDALTLSDQMNEEFILNTAERLHLSREQMKQMAQSASAEGEQKTVLDIADALVEEEQRAERTYEWQTAQRAFDEKTQKLEKSANVGENVKQLIQLAKVVHSDVAEVLRDGREDNPVMGQLKIPQNVSLDVLALYERVLADREMNGNRPGKLEQQIEKDGFTDVIMKIHNHEPETQAKVRGALTVEKLRNAVKGGGFGALLGVGNGTAALEKAAGVPQKPQNTAQKNSPQHI